MGSSQSTASPSAMEREQHPSDPSSNPTPSDLLNHKSSPFSVKSSSMSQLEQRASPIPTAKPTPQEIESFDIRAYKPVPLTAAQEAQVRDIYYKTVRDKCGAEVREFAQCAKGRSITIPFACRSQRRAMESCMISYATREEEDKAREQWFAAVGQRRREKEKDEAWKADQLKQKAEWWRDYREGREMQPSQQEPKRS